jgi:hypothetical protein
MKCSVEGCGKKVTAKSFCSTHYARFRLYGSPDSKSFDHVSIDIKFWLNVDKAGEDDCWMWKRPASSNGYGRIRVNETGKEQSAHRVSWWLSNGKQDIPSGMVIMHSCDNKLCVNPKHLSIGTLKDNTQDMIRKGRNKVVRFVGSTNGNALLNDDKVRVIKTSSLNNTQLGKMFGVSPSCIADIKKGRSWAHVKVEQNETTI